MQYYAESNYSRTNNPEETSSFKLSELAFKPENVLSYFDGNEDLKTRLFVRGDYANSETQVCARSLRDFRRIEKIYNKIDRKHRKIDKIFWEFLKKLIVRAQSEFPAAQELFLISKVYSHYYITVDLKKDARNTTYGIESSRNLREDIKNQSFTYSFCHYANDEVEELFRKENTSRKLSLWKTMMFNVLEGSLLSRIIYWYQEVFLKDKKFTGYHNYSAALNISIAINGRDYFISKTAGSSFRLASGKNHLVFKE